MSSRSSTIRNKKNEVKTFPSFAGKESGAGGGKEHGKQRGVLREPDVQGELLHLQGHQHTQVTQGAYHRLKVTPHAA